jgi:hypothetical protein
MFCNEEREGMEGKALEQLWYTWSDIGVDNVGPGFRVRAASPGLTSLTGPLYSLIRTYADYQLPDGIDSDVIDSPISLAMVSTSYGKILLHKVSLPKDRFGRSGNFFAHFLFGLPDYFSARDAIRLWKSPFWQVSDVPEHEQSTQLALLSLDDIEQKELEFDFAEIQNHLRSLIHAFLAPSRLQQRVAINGASHQIAALIWGLTQSVPKTLLPSNFTFTTYEYNTDQSHETIVGTTTTHEPGLEGHSTLKVKYMPDPQPYPAECLAVEIANFIDFAVQCLIQTPNGRSSQLEDLVKQAERANITSVKEFITSFQDFLVKEKLPPLVDTLAHALMSADWLAVSQLCKELTRLFPPADNAKAWYYLLQSLSEAPLRECILGHQETHQWLLGSLAAVSPEVIGHLSLWHSGSWKDLAQSLALDLPDEWHKEAIAITLLASKWSQMNLTADLVTTYQLYFTEVLQQFVIESEEKYLEAVLDFFQIWEPNNPAQKSRLCTILINTEGSSPETRRQLTAILRSDQSSPLPQVSSHITPQPTFASAKKLIADLLTRTSRLFVHTFQQRKWRRSNHTER